MRLNDGLLQVWRILNDEKDVWEGQALENRERLLPLEHSDLNDIESSVAQKRIRQVGAALEHESGLSS